MSSALPTTFGPYALLHVLGRGGNGTAYLAVPLDASAQPSPVVVKILHPDAARLDRARFGHEAKLAVVTNIDALATVYDVGLVGETPYIAMELVRGMSLSRSLSALRDREAVLGVSHVLDLVGSALSGLKELHEAKDRDGRELETIHRDLSPRNLMIESQGRVRILDLGLGRSRLRAPQTQSGVIIGTPGYMSPEQALGRPPSQRSDVYAIGAIFWELLVGRSYIRRGELVTVLIETVKRAFEPPSSLRPGLSPKFDGVCGRALERDPEGRFASAAELLAEIEALRDSALEPEAAAAAVPLSTVYELDLGADELVRHVGQYQRPVDEPVSPDTVVIARRVVSEVAPTAVLRRPPRTAALVFLLGIAALASALWWAPTSPPASESDVSPTSIQAPTADPREPEIKPAIEPEPPQIEEASAPPTPRERRRRQDPKPVPAAPDPSVEELMADLHQLARSVKRARPDLAAAVDDLINAGLFETARGDAPAVRARLEEISRQLEQLRESEEKREDRPDR